MLLLAAQVPLLAAQVPLLAVQVPALAAQLAEQVVDAHGQQQGMASDGWHSKGRASRSTALKRRPMFIMLAHGPDKRRQVKRISAKARAPRSKLSGRRRHRSMAGAS